MLAICQNTSLCVFSYKILKNNIMKTKISILLLALVTVLSCDELDKLTEFDVTEDFRTSVSIVLEDNNGGMASSLNESSTIDIASNQDIKDNLDLIESITINTLTYEISNFTGASGTTITQASINFADQSIAVDDINLSEADSNNTLFTISDSDKIGNIATYLKTNNVLTVTVSGTVSNTPASFDVIVDLDATVKIDVI